MAKSIRDGKDKFYRTLKLNKEDKKLIKFYRELSKKMKQDSDKKWLQIH